MTTKNVMTIGGEWVQVEGGHSHDQGYKRNGVWDESVSDARYLRVADGQLLEKSIITLVSNVTTRNPTRGVTVKETIRDVCPVASGDRLSRKDGGGYYVVSKGSDHIAVIA